MEGLNENDVDEEQQQASSSKVAYVMTELHEFLKQVFERLPAQSLFRCSRVCKRWKIVATFILKARDSFTWAQYNYHIHHSDEDDKAVIVPYALGYFGLDLTICLQEAWSVPSLCLLLSEFQEASDFHGAPHDFSVIGVDGHISSALPSSCDVVALTVPGTVCTTRNLTTSAESEGEGGAVAILFPKMEGVRITRTSIRHHQGNIWEQSGIERHQDVKCVLTFTPKACTTRKLAGERLQEAFFKDGQTPVIAGAIVDNVLSYSDKKNATECIIFSGERISAASVLLDQNVNTEEGVHRELARLKNAGLPEKNSLGLMFACIGRGSDFFSAWDVESSVFRTVFPKTPLFGLFGNGEIGCTNLPQCNKWKKVPEMGHGYTTIMCLISFG